MHLPFFFKILVNTWRRGMNRSSGYSTNIILMMFIHLLIDGISVSALYVIGVDMENFVLAVISYDILAFALQPLIGILVDIKKIEKQLIIVGLILAIFVSYLDIPLLIVATFIGIANAMVHVGGFSVTYQSSNNKMGPLGLFVSTGSIGLGIGVLFPESRLIFFILSIFAVFLVMFFYKKIAYEEEDISNKKYKYSVLPIILVLIVVLLRGFGGAISSPGYTTSQISRLTLYIALFIGKATGGLIADKIGITKTIIFGFVPSMIGFVFFPHIEIIYIISLALFNLTMALTLFLAIRLIKPYASFAFGLTAALLLLGYILALGFKEIVLVEPWMVGIVVLVSCVMIIITNDRVKNNNILGGNS